MKKFIILSLLALVSLTMAAQVPYYAASQGKNKTYTYFSTKFHPGHNNQQMYIVVDHGLNDHFDIVTDATIGTGWEYQGFGFRFNGISSKYFSLGGQLMADFNLGNNYKYEYTCASLYLNGTIAGPLHWVSNTWYTIYKGSTKNTVDQWTYLGYTIGKFTPMVGAITSITNDCKTDPTVGVYANLYKNGYVYLWASGLAKENYDRRIVIGFDYKF
jgi:hypothetical protein